MLKHFNWGKISGLAACLVAAVLLFVFSSPAHAQAILDNPPAQVAHSGVGPPIPMDLVIKPAPAAEPSSAPEKAEPQDLVLQLIINQIEMEDVVEALQQNGKLYLPVGSLSGILDFAIKVDPATKSAKGWFFRQQNTLELTDHSGEIKGKSVTIPPGAVFWSNDDLYVDADLLHAWMRLDFATDLHRMSLSITSHDPLPFQAKKLREAQHEALSQKNQPAAPKNVKAVVIPYSIAQWPTVDLTVSPSYDSTNPGIKSSYSLLAVGDFGYLTTRLYAAGSLPDDDLSDLRLSFGRDDYQKSLLGPLHASSFRFGDINSVSLEQVASPTQGRGVMLTNRDLDRPDNFDVTNFIGDSKPGWEVELYRNGTLIDFQTVGQDGRYSFTNVPILFGNNQFRLAFYGPQGQVEEINKTVNAESSLLEKGQISYNFSADQKNKSLFGVGDTTSALTPDGFSSVGEVEYGVTRWLTIAGGAAHTVLMDGEHNYTTAGVRSSFGSLLAAVDGAYDETDSTYSTRLSLSTDIHNTLLSFQQKFAHDFLSEQDTTLTTPINRQTVARADKQFGDLGMSLSYTGNAYEGGRYEHLWTNQISQPVFGNMNFTNTIKYDKDNLGLDSFTGSAFLRGYYKRVLLGAQLDYEDKPLRQFDAFKMDALYAFSPLVNDKITFTSQLSGQKVNTLENTATWDMDRYKLSVTGRATDRGDYFVGLTFNVSVGRVPDSGKWIVSGKSMAEMGTVAVVPYLDANYNQLRDAGEAVPPNSAIRIGSQSVKVDRNGTAIVSQLQPNLPVSVSLDPDNQKANPFWSTGVDAYKVVPRPGKITTLPLPVFETSQIDGTVSVPEGVNAKDIAIELVNADGQTVRTAHTAFDGYYLIEGVMPGAYKLRVSADSLSERKLRQDEVPDVTVKVSDFFVKDIRLVASDAPAAPPPAPKPESAAAAPETSRPEQEQAAPPPLAKEAEMDGPPMPAVKPAEVMPEPLDSALAKQAQPVAPEADAPTPKPVAPVAAAPVAPARQALVVVNDAAPVARPANHVPHFVIVNEGQPAAAQATSAHKPGLVIVNDPW